jgi:hypothetical protein
MSRVTNVILTAGVGSHKKPDDEIDSVNRFLREAQNSVNGQFAGVTVHAYGRKRMECRLYLSAFKHADTESGRSGTVAHKEMVQVWFKEAEEEVFWLRYSGGLTPA